MKRQAGLCFLCVYLASRIFLLHDVFTAQLHTITPHYQSCYIAVKHGIMANEHITTGDSSSEKAKAFKYLDSLLTKILFRRK